LLLDFDGVGFTTFHFTVGLSWLAALDSRSSDGARPCVFPVGIGAVVGRTTIDGLRNRSQRIPTGFLGGRSLHGCLVSISHLMQGSGKCQHTVAIADVQIPSPVRIYLHSSGDCLFAYRVAANAYPSKEFVMIDDLFHLDLHLFGLLCSVRLVLADRHDLEARR